MSEDSYIETIGGCELLSQLNEGAMGQVFKARQLSTDRIVAVKILPEELAKDPLYVELFEREGRVLRELKHTNIVQMIQCGNEAGIPFCVMEFVEGESLFARLARRGKFLVDEALGSIIQIARGLEFAWVKDRVIHRDVKPANVLLRQDGVIKVADFGFAGHRWRTKSVVGTEGVMGTPHFLSPEQVTGDSDLDFRCDVYALGVTLFQLLTGQLPYQAATAEEVMRKHLDEPVPNPNSIDSTIGRPVVRLIQKMMAKDRNARHSSYGELLMELERVKKNPVDKSSVRFLRSLMPQ